MILDSNRIVASLLLVVVAFCSSASAFYGPETTGDYATGAHDFDFTDRHYPSDLGAFDANGRRIMARAYYPVCKKIDVDSSNGTAAMCQSTVLGRQRKYLEPGEWDAFYHGYKEPKSILGTFSLTHGYIDAPPLASRNPEFFPVVVYTPGLGGRVSDNTALLEEIASHGYTVFAMGSPGMLSGVLYPSDGEVVLLERDYPEIYNELNNTNRTNYLGPPYSDDLQVRHDKIEAHLTNSILRSGVERVRDDQRALVDYLQKQNESEDTNSDMMVQSILGNNTSILDSVVFMGYSFGGAAAASTAQVDSRAVCAINLDGTHQSLDLFGNDSRVPIMHLDGRNDESVPFYWNEFFFESLLTMGTNPNITRLGIADVTHLDFSDYRHFSQLWRHTVGINTTVDGEELFEILSDFCVGFLNKCLKMQDGWDPKETIDKYPSVEPIDVSYVAEWRAEELGLASASSIATSSAGLQYVVLVIGALLFS